MWGYHAYQELIIRFGCDAVMVNMVVYRVGEAYEVLKKKKEKRKFWIRERIWVCGLNGMEWWRLLWVCNQVPQSK